MDWLNTDDDVEIYYETAGDGQPLVFISGYMGIANIWDDTVNSLKNKFLCITHDNRGYGRSGKPKTAEKYSIERHAQDTKQILDKLKITKDVILITHSMGCNIATAFAAKYPKMVKGIIYIAAHYSKSDLSEGFKTADDYRKVFQTPSSQAHFYEKLGLKPQIAQEAAKWSKTTLINNANAMCCYNGDEIDYSKFNFPVFIIQGENDIASPPQKAAVNLQKAIKGAELTIIPNINHFPMAENPDVINKIIYEKIKKM